ncbi:MAG: valine--tRNA ligase [Ignavibacteria bacterium]|jgi:valyl-tRNA synthetase
MAEVPNKYEIKEVEQKWQSFWEDNEIYKSKINKNKKKYSIVIPPPNVTGILHIGHILNNTIQDIYCRWKRMNGFEVCWVPGTDHAGISTQLMVEKDLATQGIKKEEIGREEFVKKVWEWKEKHGGIILKQLKKLGVSVDWSKERFTLDEGLSRAVKEVFVDLYRKGLIYKGKRIINWDPITKTALSDDEIEFKELKDKLYYVKYPILDSDEYLTIATTRPETMFGDTAVAVNPLDNRYNHLTNKTVILPLVNKNIPIVFDSYVDMDFGTGALKITPSHDMNDFEIGKKHNLPQVNILTKDAKLNENGLEFQGMGVNEARKKVVRKLKEEGYLIKEDEYIHNVSFAQKSGATIEPMVSDQWFVSMKKLAEPAIKVVKEGKIKFYPDRYTKVYFHWMDNIRDWCISRQLWWGHQIPIWYKKDTGEIYCDLKPPSDIENWIQEPDVLDTWFSSWLWPISVFGWENKPNEDKNEQLNYYYPTDFLATASDIIFLWVARMIMAGLEYRKDIPFKEVYFNSIVRDGKGRKMSKTLGNSPDPLVVMDKYGTDALRFTMVYLAPLGNDVLFDIDKTEIGRNFVTKLWNAGRFLLMNKAKIYESDEYGDDVLKDDFTDKWMDSRFNSELEEVEKCLSEYKLNDYTKALYNFVWSDFCDWYIEILKIKIDKYPKSAKYIIDKALKIYEDIVKLLHPVIPFVTEEIWHILEEGRDGKSVSFSEFPEIEKDKINSESEKKFEIFQEIVSGIRNLKAENDIPYSEKCKVYAICSNDIAEKTFDEYNDYIFSLCNLSTLEKIKKLDGDKYLSKVLADFEIHIPFEVNEKQIEKYKKEIENLEKYIANIDKKLSNQNFVEKAPKELIESERAKREEAMGKLKKLKKLV